MTENIIKVENLIFEYAKTGEEENITVRAIDDVSFEIEKGSFTAIIGKNGSGKSTLAKNLNGLLIPSSGAVYVAGYDTKDDKHIWDVRQTAGMVFQNPDNQLVSAIVEDDVAFGPENLGVPPEEIRERVDKALEDVNMGAFKKKAPHLLSGGQKQRIAIAGVVAMKPQCIIFDEPTAMLDPKGRKEIMAIIDELHVGDHCGAYHAFHGRDSECRQTDYYERGTCAAGRSTGGSIQTAGSYPLREP